MTQYLWNGTGSLDNYAPQDAAGNCTTRTFDSNGMVTQITYGDPDSTPTNGNGARTEWRFYGDSNFPGKVTAMLDLVPLARARRKVANVDREVELVGKPLCATARSCSRTGQRLSAGTFCPLIVVSRCGCDSLFSVRFRMRSILTLVLAVSAGTGLAAADNTKPAPTRPAIFVVGWVDAVRSSQMDAKLAALEPKLLACYERLLATRPGIEGDVTTELELTAKGAAAAPAVRHAFDADAAACVTASLGTLALGVPKPRRPAKVTIKVAFRSGPARAIGATAFDGLGGGLPSMFLSPASADPTSGPGSAFGLPRQPPHRARPPTVGGRGRGCARQPCKVDSKPKLITLERPAIEGTLEPAIVARYVRRQTSKLRSCYDAALAASPTLAGTVTAVFEIAADGKVRAATATGVDKQLGACVAKVVAAIEFPAPARGGRVSYPIRFTPPLP